MKEKIDPRAFLRAGPREFVAFHPKTVKVRTSVGRWRRISSERDRWREWAKVSAIRGEEIAKGAKSVFLCIRAC